MVAMTKNAVAQWKGAVVGILIGLGVAYLLQVSPLDGFRSTCQTFPEPTSGHSLKADNIHNGVNALITANQNINSMVNFEHRRLKFLLALWETSNNLSLRNHDDELLKDTNIPFSKVPRAPHLEKCKDQSIIYNRLDAGNPSQWKLWKGKVMGPNTYNDGDTVPSQYYRQLPYPPWVQGADEDNLPLTRRVQVDIWEHQHPKNCQDPDLRFLLADWETDPGFGMGAQIASMAGLLAIALNEQRILVTNYFNRADHEECIGSDHARWSCYFLRETSKECIDQAHLLASQSSAWEQGLITSKDNYTSKEIWTGKVPRIWGEPWKLMQPTTQINGKLLLHHKASDRRWWRAQSVRYLMRFSSEYTCNLLNVARHEAFGVQAARMVLDSLPYLWPEVPFEWNETEIDHFVWNTHKPWVPRPFINLHVRQGDKAREMKIVGFHDYMKLAQHLRIQFPHARNIWLSTEMQEVIEESKVYSKQWDIYYTNVSRQTGNTSMPTYEASLGRALSTNYPLVNFLLAADADFFIGALGSTWCYLIDGMRTTGGKVMAGYLSVNKYRFW